MEKIWFFDFEQRSWSNKTCTGGLPSWSFGHAHKRGKHLLAYGTPTPPTEESLLEASTPSLSLFRIRDTLEMMGSVSPISYDAVLPIPTHPQGPVGMVESSPLGYLPWSFLGWLK